MSAAVQHAVPNPAENAEDKLDWLAAQILRNRFIPRPPPDRIFVGDGDFLAIGVEFLKWFVRLGKLLPSDRVLDLGCGIGRMALPLTQYLDAGSYDGVDIVDEGIAWCMQHITPHYERFRFHRLDVQHEIYNPEGRETTTGIRLPFADGSFDFVFMTSVVTHLHAEDVRAYAREIRRVMAPQARLFLTAFMLNGAAREGLAAGNGALSFAGAGPGPEFHADAANPLAAVAFEEDFLLGLFLEAGLGRNQPAVYGRWSGRATPGPSFQDINLLEIDPATRPGARRLAVTGS
jgi:SAM-dependent methyltransferase